MAITPLAPSTLQSLASANANGAGKSHPKDVLTIDNTFSNALQPQTSNLSLGTPNPQSTLTATFNPTASQPVTDLAPVTTHAAAAPSPVVSATTVIPPVDNSSDFSTAAATTSGASAPFSASSTDSSSPIQTAAPSITPSSDSSAGLYSAVASAGASNIRGTGVDLVA